MPRLPPPFLLVPVTPCLVPSLSYETIRSRHACNSLLPVQVIAIDEGQFFADLHEFCTHAADTHKQIVIVAGLSGDFRRRPFGQINDLLSHADTVTNLTARCTFCSPHSPATFTFRVIADERTAVVGGADKYVPVCRKHYNSLTKHGDN